MATRPAVLNWMVVHPINEESPLYQFTEKDLQNADFEPMVQVSGFDPVFSNQVLQRTSYTMEELVWGARFSNMYHQSKNGNTTILELDKPSQYEKTDLPPTNQTNKTHAVRTTSL